MNAKVDQFCDRLRDRLNTIEAWLESVKADIRSLPWKVRKAHQSKLEEARTKLQAQKERVEQTRGELKAEPQLAAAIADAFTVWMTAPEPRVPHPGAEPAEAHAAATIDHAVAGIDEVKDAMLYAGVARLPAVGK